MVENEGRVEIPIEISPQDTREINQLLERIERAEAKLNKINNELPDENVFSGGGGPSDIANPMSEQSHTNKRRRRKSNELPDIPERVEENEIGGIGELETAGFLSFTGGAPIKTHYEESPILGGQYSNMPDAKNRDRTSRSPVVLSSDYKNLKGDVQDLKSKLTPLIEAENSLGTAASIFKNPAGFFSGIISRIIPILGPILIAKGFMDLVISELIKPGGLWDRRFKIDVAKQIQKTLDREKIKLIRAGLVDIRVSSGTTLRGSRGGISTNLSFIKRGNPIYSETLETYAKGNYQ